MEARFIDAFLAPILVPSIMILNGYKLLESDRPRLLYITVTIGTVLSMLFSSAHMLIRRRIRSRTWLTYFVTIEMTSATLVSAICFHLIRLNLSDKEYQLPLTTRGQLSAANVFRYHFYNDIVPGLILFTQIQACTVIKFHLLSRAKRKFTFGEASIISQLLSAAHLVWALTFYSKVSWAGPFQVNLTTDIILNIGFIAFVTLFLPSFLFLNGGRTLVRYVLLGLCIFSSYVSCRTLISATSNHNPITWLVDHIFSTHQRISLFSLWLSTVTACISFATSWTSMVGQTNSLVRKIFHLAICVVFISGYNQDVDFARFAAGGAVIVLFILELIRAWNLHPIGPHLEKVCRSLRGKWDNKYITLSHIYLLVGTFLPLWLIPGGSESSRKLVLSSGLISVGVGDTAAAIVGTLLGKSKISPDRSKTLEGLAANILAMIVFKIFWVGHAGFVDEFSFVMAAIVAGFVEALTSTCDNLVLPLVMTLLVTINCEAS